MRSLECQKFKLNYILILQTFITKVKRIMCYFNTEDIMIAEKGMIQNGDGQCRHILIKKMFCHLKDRTKKGVGSNF